MSNRPRKLRGPGEQAIWIVRYWVSRWLMSAALAALPSDRYGAEVKRRIYGLRDEAIAAVRASQVEPPPPPVS